jgi:hypothetical protein
MSQLSEDHFHEKDYPISLKHSENLAPKRPLVVLVAILAEEYIQIAKQNPDIFSK